MHDSSYQKNYSWLQEKIPWWLWDIPNLSPFSWLFWKRCNFHRIAWWLELFISNLCGGLTLRLFLNVSKTMRTSMTTKQGSSCCINTCWILGWWSISFTGQVLFASLQILPSLLSFSACPLIPPDLVTFMIF